MASLKFFNAEEFRSKRGRKSDVREYIKRIVDMPKDMAVTVTGSRSKLRTIRTVLYSENPGKFRIYDQGNKITVKWKKI